jgi:hypothetical protein
MMLDILCYNVRLLETMLSVAAHDSLSDFISIHSSINRAYLPFLGLFVYDSFFECYLYFICIMTVKILQSCRKEDNKTEWKWMKLNGLVCRGRIEGATSSYGCSCWCAKMSLCYKYYFYIIVWKLIQNCDNWTNVNIDKWRVLHLSIPIAIVKDLICTGIFEGATCCVCRLLMCYVAAFLMFHLCYDKWQRSTSTAYERNKKLDLQDCRCVWHS